MPRPARVTTSNDVNAVTDAVLTASRLLIAVSARSIAAVDEALTIPQFRVLVVLRMQGPMKLTSLAEHLSVNPSTATRMVDRLVTTGLINRQANPASRRELVVALTEMGTTVVDDVTRRRRNEIARIVSRMTPTTQKDLIDALSAFAAAGNEPTIADQTDLPWL